MTEVALGGRNLVFFDGVCVMCNGTVHALVRFDRKKVLSFATLQGLTAETVLGERASEISMPGSMVYVRAWATEREARFEQSDAMLQILCDLGGVWRIVSWARIVPRFLRDRVYRWVARNRYRWFGRRESCFVPEPGERGRFLG
jgi:predicted DCC family thiol-disulfide oxidoreductase YuxK